MDHRLTAGILAGGKSSRMGRNKAFLEGEGGTFLEHTARLFAENPRISQVLVSVADKTGYEQLPYPLVEDVRQGYGPLEGLYRLLLAAQEPWVFVAATDMPQITSELITYMMEQPRGQAKILIPATAQGQHPLFGIYSREVLGSLEELFGRGEHRLRALQELVPTKILYPVEQGFSEELFCNVNTPEEYQKWSSRREGETT